MTAVDVLDQQNLDIAVKPPIYDCAAGFFMQHFPMRSFLKNIATDVVDSIIAQRRRFVNTFFFFSLGIF